MQILGLIIVGIILGSIFGITVKAAGWREAAIVWISAIVLVGFLALGIKLAVG